MSAPLIAQLDNLGAYALPDGRYALVSYGHELRQGRHAIHWSPELAAVLRRVLVSGGQLYAQGGKPVFVLDGVAVPYASGEAAWERLHSVFAFGLSGAEDVVEELVIPPSARTIQTPVDAWAAVARANEVRPTRLSSNDCRFVVSLASSSATVEVPEWGGILRHPLVGEAPGGWFWPRPPERPANYNLLKELFSHVALDSASHCALYSYLLGAFHAESILKPVPLLLVDSWVQGVGKSEVCGAISELIDGSRSSLRPPLGSGDDDTMVAHFNSGKRMANLDNLVTDRPWNNAWLCALLTDRNAGARAKYSAQSQVFGGRLVTVTSITGDAVIHPDMVSRAWRVQLWGEGRALPFRPNDFARQHRQELQAQAYWAVSNCQPLDDMPACRTSEFMAVGAGAYFHVFGTRPDKIRSLLAQMLLDVRVHETAAQHLLRLNGVELGTSMLTSPPRRPPAAVCRRLAGLRSNGMQITDDGKVKEVTL